MSPAAAFVHLARSKLEFCQSRTDTSAFARIFTPMFLRFFSRRRLIAPADHRPDSGFDGFAGFQFFICSSLACFFHVFFTVCRLLAFFAFDREFSVSFQAGLQDNSLRRGRVSSAAAAFARLQASYFHRLSPTLSGRRSLEQSHALRQHFTPENCSRADVHIPRQSFAFDTLLNLPI